MERNILMWLINDGWSEQIAAAIAEAFPSGSLEHGTRGKHMAEVANILMTWQLKRAQSDLKESKKRQKLCRGTLLQKERTMRTRRIKEKKKGLYPRQSSFWQPLFWTPSAIFSVIFWYNQQGKRKYKGEQRVEEEPTRWEGKKWRKKEKEP